MLRKGQIPPKPYLPLSGNKNKPKPVIIKETKSSNNYESIKEKVETNLRR